MPDLRALIAAATDRPWRTDGRYARWSNANGEGEVLFIAAEPADAALIVAAVNALPALLDVVEAAREVLAEVSWWDEGRSWDDLRTAVARLDEVTK